MSIWTRGGDAGDLRTYPTTHLGRARRRLPSSSSARRPSRHAGGRFPDACIERPGCREPAEFTRNGRVTFELHRADARSIQVAGGDGLGKGPFPMTQGADGTWSVTIPHPVPGFHYYWFVLDGVDVNDPTSLTYFGYGKETSGIEIPEPGADY